MQTLEAELAAGILEHRGIGPALVAGTVDRCAGVAGAPGRLHVQIHWPINEQDALDILTLASLLHRRLDSAVRTR